MKIAFVMVNRKIIAGICAVLIAGWSEEPLAQRTNQFRLGYFEGGMYPVHSVLREEFARQLRGVLPDGYEVAFVPEGYRSAGWKRDSSRIMAKQLVQVKSIDMVVALGPWVVEDLLEAGFARPILAMHQFDPVAQGLVGKNGRPVAPNLTVHVRPAQLEDDLKVLTKLVKVKRLGVLYFPSGDEKEKIIGVIDSLGKSLGFEVVTAEGFDNNGTYAFFKAYYQLNKKIDALYLPPLWGMNDVKIGAFFPMVARDRIPTFTSEGRYLVERGAFGSNTAFSISSEARYNAFKAVRILLGELPANLPIEFRGGTALAVNERTAQQCHISLSTEVTDEAYLVPAPIPESTPFYSLTDAVQRALSSNPGYLAHNYAVEAAVQAAKQTYASYLPRIVAEASVAHLDDNTVANSRGALEKDRYRSMLLLRQRIFSAEAIKTIQVAAKQKHLAQIDLRQAKLDLELAVAAAYLNYLETKEALETEVRYRLFIDHNMEIAGTRTILGESSDIDLIRWKDDRHKATSRIIRAKSGVKVSIVLLNVLFNLPGNSQFALDTTLYSEGRFWRDYDVLSSLVPTAITEMHLQDLLVDRAQKVNPILQSLDMDIAIQRDLVSQNTARYYPTLDFRASLNYANQLADNPPTFVEKNTTWSVWGGFTLPLFLGTERIRERAKLKAKLSQIEFAKDAASLDVMGRVQSRAYDLTADMSRVPRALRSAELATQNLERVQEKYEASKLGLIDILDAYSNARSDELSAITSRYSFYLSMARLVHDIGWSTGGRSTFREEFLRHLEELRKE